MSLNIEQKKAVVAEVTQVLAGAQVTMLAEYRGLTVAQMTVLRRKAHEGKVYLRVVKNTLARRAVAGLDLPSAAMSDSKFSLRASASKEALPMAQCTMPALSVRYWA